MVASAYCVPWTFRPPAIYYARPTEKVKLGGSWDSQDITLHKAWDSAAHASPLYLCVQPPNFGVIQEQVGKQADSPYDVAAFLSHRPVLQELLFPNCREDQPNKEQHYLMHRGESM